MISTNNMLRGVAALISLDIIITVIAVGGMGATELNPIVNALGLAGFMVAKIILSSIALVVIYKYCIPSSPTAARYGVLTLGLVYGAVCASNLYQVAGAVA